MALLIDESPLPLASPARLTSLQKSERPGAEYREAISVIEQQTGRMSRMVEDMFSLTRADMYQTPLEFGEIYLDEMVGDTIRAAGVI